MMTAFYLAMLPAYLLAWGSALYLYWGWFVVPLGAPEIAWIHAVGLWATKELLKEPRREPKNLGKERTTEEKVEDVIWVLVVLFVGVPLSIATGWIIKGFMP